MINARLPDGSDAIIVLFITGVFNLVWKAAQGLSALKPNALTSFLSALMSH